MTGPKKSRRWRPLDAKHLGFKYEQKILIDDGATCYGCKSKFDVLDGSPLLEMDERIFKTETVRGYWLDKNTDCPKCSLWWMFNTSFTFIGDPNQLDAYNRGSVIARYLKLREVDLYCVILCLKKQKIRIPTDIIKLIIQLIKPENPKKERECSAM
jgi:hypothetical protein